MLCGTLSATKVSLTGILLVKHCQLTHHYQKYVIYKSHVTLFPKILAALFIWLGRTL